MNTFSIDYNSLSFNKGLRFRNNDTSTSTYVWGKVARVLILSNDKSTEFEIPKFIYGSMIFMRVQLTLNPRYNILLWTF